MTTRIELYVPVQIYQLMQFIFFSSLDCFVFLLLLFFIPSFIHISSPKYNELSLKSKSFFGLLHLLLLVFFSFAFHFIWLSILCSLSPLSIALLLTLFSQFLCTMNTQYLFFLSMSKRIICFTRYTFSNCIGGDDAVSVHSLYSTIIRLVQLD